MLKKVLQLLLFSWIGVSALLVVWYIQFGIAHSNGGIGPQEGTVEEIQERLIEKLIKQLSDPEPQNRLQAASLLATNAHTVDDKTPFQKAIPALRLALTDKQDEVREAAAHALGEIGKPLKSEHLAVVLEDSNKEVRMAALYALDNLNEKETIPFLLKRLQDPAIEIRHQAAWALFLRGDSRALSTLAKNTSLQNENIFARPYTANQIQKKKSDQALKGLLFILANKEDKLKCLAAKVLADMNERKIVPDLIKALNSSSSEVLFCVANALGKIQDQQAVPALIKLLSMPQSKDESVQYSIIDALGKIGDQAAIPILLPLLQSQSNDIRCIAAESLGRLKAEAAVPALTMMLKDKDDNIRNDAESALRDVDTEAARKALTAYRNN